MSVLMAILPGFRDLRVPLAVGVAWSVAGLLVFWGVWPNVLESSTPLRQWTNALLELPVVVQWAAFGVVAYLVGVVLLPFSRATVDLLWRPAQRLKRFASIRIHPSRMRSGRRIYRLATRILNDGGKSQLHLSVAETLRREFAKLGAPNSSVLAHLYHPGTVIAHFENTALQLWSKAPEQYQEYDRMRAESQFRDGLAIPLAVVAVALAQVHIGMTVLMAAGVGMLIVLARRVRIDQGAMMANALYQGLVVDVSLEATKDALGRTGLDASAHSAGWAAGLAVALHRLGDFEGLDSVWNGIMAEFINSYGGMPPEEYDAANSTWLDAIRTVLDRENPDLRDEFEAHLERFISA